MFKKRIVIKGFCTMRDIKIELHKPSEYLSERECLQSKEATTTRFDKCICTWHFEKMLSPKGTKKHSRSKTFETSKKMNKKSRIFVRDFLIYTIINLNPFRGNISNKRIVMLNKYQCYICIFQ